VRLDSGDLVADSQWVRRRLDAHGWNDVEIFASGDLSEERIAGLLERGAEIGGFGVGTSLATSADAPALGVIYKLVEVEHPRGVRGAAKLSSAKATFPGRKQVYRFRDPAGRLERDVIALESEEFPGGEPLLEPVILGGKRLAPPVAVPRIREKCLEELRRLPPRLLELAPVEPFRVERSPRLLELLEETRRALELAHAQGSGGTGR
jgi:nicotinate phosphoribosyltransferase